MKITFSSSEVWLSLGLGGTQQGRAKHKAVLEAPRNVS